VIAQINQSNMARKSCARSRPRKRAAKRACGCSSKPLSTLIYCFAAARNVACVWRLRVRRFALALEIESAPFLLGQNRQIGAPLLEKEKRIGIARKNELLWSARYHNCWCNVSNRHNYFSQPSEVLVTENHHSTR
jgi:hypothetical protein